MSRRLVIDGVEITDESDCYVIAEVGHNHQGDLEKCKALFDKAKEAGADAVKLQKRDNRALYTRAMYDKPYDHRNSYGRTYGEHRDALEFGKPEYEELKDYAAGLGITFFATPFDFPSADFLHELDMPAYKIASGDLTNIPLIEHVASFGKPMILSTGGGTMEDVERAVGACVAINPQVAVLQCTANYPAAFEEMNLNVVGTFRERFPDLIVGLSSHDNGIAMAVAAYVLGARVIEKHFTLNRALKGTDHAFSLEPIGLTKMVRDLRRTRMALGDGVKAPYPSEKPAIFKMGKTLVAARDLPAGHVVTADDVAIKSPAEGPPPYELSKVLGKRLKVPLGQDEGFTFEVLDSREVAIEQDINRSSARDGK